MAKDDGRGPELPSFEAVSGLRPAVYFGLVEKYAESALTAEYKYPGERPWALRRALRRALLAAAQGDTAPERPAPRWFRGLVLDHLRTASGSMWIEGAFAMARLFERLGLIELEADDTYVLAMVGSLRGDRAAYFRSDPGAIDRALWRVFEVEGGGEVSLTNIDRYSRTEDTWARAFRELVADGTIDRRRVLESCLDALGRDFSDYRARWYQGTFTDFAPTLDELDALQGRLIGLLRSTLARTVGLALSLLLELHKAGRLRLDDALPALPAAALVGPKGTGMAALRLARSVRRSHRAAAADVARAAVAHPNADVQRAAVALLAEVGEDSAVDPELLAPGVRADLGWSVPATPDSGDRHVPPPPPPPAAAVTAADVAERVAALLEDPSDVAEVEAVLAALVEPHYDEELRPLRKRALSVVERGRTRDEGESWLPGQVARIVLGILGEAPPPAVPLLPAQRFLLRRFRELRQSAGPLLATPDLPGGWVSAAALVERLSRSTDIRHADLIAALLRLHPDGRAAALEATTGEIPDAVRVALAAAEPESHGGRRRFSRPTPWLEAAHRSFGPWSDAEAPVLSGSFIRRAYWDSDFTLTGSGSWRVDDRPTSTPKLSSWRQPLYVPELASWIPHLAAIWPHDADHLIALPNLRILHAPDGSVGGGDIARTLDALAAHPGRIGPLAAHSLASGLAAHSATDRIHASDAFLDLVATGRLAPAAFAEILAQHASVLPVNRWAGSLGMAGAAPGGAGAVLEVLTLVLPELATSLRGIHAPLDVYRDLSLRTARPITDPAFRAWLSEFSGSSAAARTARALLGSVRGMSAGSDEQAYAYARPSRVALEGPRSRLTLATSGGVTASGPALRPIFFDGFLGHAEQSAAALLAVAKVARTRFYTPPGMLAAQLRAADPVVTSNRDRLRFESFSACCGVYARFDALPGSLDGAILDSGTTNVDFNPPMRAALSRVAGLDPIHLQVGEDVTVRTLDEEVTERKVPLPERWLKGFAEVQLTAAVVEPVIEVSAVEGRRFLQGLPSSTSRRPVWVLPGAAGLRLSTRPDPSGIALSGIDRLGPLEPLLRFAQRLRGYAAPFDPRGVASVWQLDLDDARLTLALSPESSRGFSGEGGVLWDLADDQSADDADLVAALLAFEPQIDVVRLAAEASLSEPRVIRALGRLSAAGRVGFDVADDAYFHRELPFEPERLRSLHPRLRDAVTLVEQGAVRVDGAGFLVRSGPVDYRVRRTDDGDRCTCPWFAQFRSSRGPCKHVLAVELTLSANARDTGG